MKPIKTCFPTIVLLIGILFLRLGASSARATTYYITNAGITNHADATVTGSIAWYFATYGGGTVASPNWFVLNDPLIYYIKSRLVVPANAVFYEFGGTGAFVTARPDWVATTGDNELIRVMANANITHINLNCNFKAKYGPFVAAVTGVTLGDVTVINSAKVDGSALVYLYWATNTTVNACTLVRGGCDSPDTGMTWIGAGMSILGGNNITVSGTSIAITATCGINAAVANNVTISGCTIHDTGRGDVISDGITVYHQGTGSVNRNWMITGNTIYNSANHGVHVSSRGFHVLNNHIYNVGMKTAASNVYVGDQRTPHDCTYDIEVNNNNFSNCPLGGGPSMVKNYWNTPFYISGNTGCTDVDVRTTCN